MELPALVERTGYRRWLGLLSLWPGLPQICFGRVWLGLALAVSGAIMLNTAILASFLWTELFSEPWKRSIWVSAALFWVVAARATRRGHRRSGAEPSEEDFDQLYQKALDHYLKRRWDEAEQCLGRILRSRPRDCDALMQMAALYQRSHRTEDAVETLRRCRDFDRQRKWDWEVAHEMKRLRGAS